jgi:choline dehydrogenase-like flavoprotein
MPLDARTLPIDFQFDCDIAIVGGGPAGITLAAELIGSGLSVLLLESGPAGHQVSPPDAFDGEVADLARHPPLTLYRACGLGGTSTLWGGRCVPFDPVDFEARPHVPWSGWPVSYAELEPWYRRAVSFCEAGAYRFRRAEVQGRPLPPSLPGLDDKDIDADGLERFSRPTDFGRRYRRALEQSGNVTLVVGATCTGLTTAPNGGAVSHLSFASLPGREFRVAAAMVVLAAGALETTRLLLASGRDGGGLVGRFYMCHLEGKAAVARLKAGHRLVFGYERDGEGVYFRRHFAVPAEVQKRQRITNVILRCEPPTIADPQHRSAVLSAVWLSRTFLKAEYARKLASFGYRGDAPSAAGSSLLGRHLGNVLRGAPELALFSADWLLRHVLARRKLPYVSVAGRDGSFTLDYNAEQVPNPDSRVTLGDERDAFGIPRLRVDWRISEDDIEGVLSAHRLLGEALASRGLGRLEVDEEAIRYGYNAIGGHHIGTARMATSPERGVVDGDCRMFGLDNLYVAGSAVFPTSSHANPTLTIVALACRLAAHLRHRAGCVATTIADDRMAAE